MPLPVKIASRFGVLEHVSFMISDCRLQIGATRTPYREVLSF